MRNLQLNEIEVVVGAGATETALIGLSGFAGMVGGFFVGGPVATFVMPPILWAPTVFAAMVAGGWVGCSLTASQLR